MVVNIWILTCGAWVANASDDNVLCGQMMDMFTRSYDQWWIYSFVVKVNGGICSCAALVNSGYAHMQ